MALSKRDSVLWAIYDPTKDRTSYLLGTMHLKDFKAYTYVELAERYLKKVDGYAGEMHLDEAAEADLHQYFQLPEGILLSDLYTKKQYERMASIFYKCTGAGINQLNNLMPMALSNIVAESFSYADHGLPLDQHLWNNAMKHNKKLYGLESVQDQIDILKGIPLKHQVTGLKQVLKNVNKYGRYIEKLGDLYTEGNIHELYRKSKKSLGSLRNIMLYERNTKMTKRFIDLCQSQPIFAAVGAAHLSGLSGMLHLLSSSGLVIKPIYR